MWLAIPVPANTMIKQVGFQPAEIGGIVVSFTSFRQDDQVSRWLEGPLFE